MSKPPKPRYAGTKKPGATIDADPSEVKRIDAAVKSEDGVSDITAPATMGADKVAAAAVEAKTEPAQPVQPEPIVKSASADKPSASPARDLPTSKPSAGTAEPKSAIPTPPASPTSVPPSRPVAAAAQEKRGGSALMGGLVGGLIVLALGAGLQAAGLWPNGSAGDSAAVTQLQEEVAALRSELAATGSADEVSALSAQIEELRASGASDTEARLAGLEQAIAAVNDAPDAEAALQEVEQQLASAGEATTANASRLDAIEQSLQGVDGRLAELEDSGATERVIAASALKSAIDRGQPFMTELETYANLDPEAGEVAELRDFAAEGVATRAVIAQEADAAARAMITASVPVDENAGIVDRLTASARSLVQVRPVGMAEGEDTAAVIARIEASVRDDDYERAIAEYESLPPEIQEAGAGFMDTVRARHAADQLIDRALTGALQDA